MDTPLGRTELSSDEARALLHEVGRLRSGTRAYLMSNGWQWLFVWAAVCLGAALSTLAPWKSIGAWYWSAAVPLGLAATAAIDMRVQRRSGVRRRDWPYWAIGGAITVLNVVGSLVLPPQIIVVWLWAVLGAGFAGLMALDRVYWGSIVMVGLVVGAVGAGMVVEDTFWLYPVLAVAHAAALSVVGVGVRRATPIRP